MARKDYYLILGVSRGENLRGIREAFRELAKRYHPDRAGPGGMRKFQDVQEAYETLSDPEKRRSYTRELEQGEMTTDFRPEPIISRSRYSTEPLLRQPMSVLRDFATIRPSFAPLYERFLRNFTGAGIPKGERLERLTVELILSPEENIDGGIVPVAVPVFFACPQCGGTGRDWLFPCISCNAQGTLEEKKTVILSIPPMVHDGTIVEVPIHGLGIHNFYLWFQIRIAR